MSVGFLYRVKSTLTSRWRFYAVRRALEPLKRTGTMTEDQMRAFHRAWGDDGMGADAPFLLQLLELLGAGPVLECGTGGTTLLEGAVGARLGFQAYCLEQGREWADQVRQWQPDAVRIIDAPLRSYGTYCWYDVREPTPGHFALVVCDGPYIDRSYGEPSFSAWRYGVLPWLRDNGKTFDTVLLDDVNDPRAPAILERWQREFAVRIERRKSADGELAIIRP